MSTKLKSEPADSRTAPKAGSLRDREVFEELFEEYSGAVVAYFRRQGISREQALELGQETFLRAWKGRGEFRADAAGSTWLFTIARHVLLNFWRDRQAKKREGLTLSLDQQQAPGVLEQRRQSEASPEADALGREKEELLHRELAKLPQQMRQCLELRLGDLKYREIAVILGLSIETVKSHLYQARQRLKADLESYFVIDIDDKETR